MQKECDSLDVNKALLQCIAQIRICHSSLRSRDAVRPYLLNVCVGVEVKFPADVETHSLRILARVLRLQLHHRHPDRRQEARRGVGRGGGPGPLHQPNTSTAARDGARCRARPHRDTRRGSPRQPGPLLRVREGEQLVESLPGPELRFNLIDILQSASICGHLQSKRAAQEAPRLWPGNNAENYKQNGSSAARVARELEPERTDASDPTGWWRWWWCWCSSQSHYDLRTDSIQTDIYLSI